MKNFNCIKFEMADLEPLLTVICLISGKPCQITRLTIDVRLHGGMHPSTQLKMADHHPLFTLIWVIFG